MEKQLVVRTFEPDMNALKQTAKQLAHMQDTSLNLYGQAGEVLIVVTARAYAQAAATELTENVAEQFELALGPAAYGRGKGSLAYFTAGELIQSESTIAAADPATGALLAEEFSHTKRGPSVFDFGDGSYNDSRVVAKIKNAVYKYAEEGNAPQIAAARAAAAARFAHADFGVASVGMGTGAEVVYLAVAHRGYVYIKRIKNGEGAGKVVALSALDMVRRYPERFSAACLTAGLDGIRRGLTPPPEITENLYEMSPAALAAQGVPLLPDSLEAALNALEADGTVTAALGPHVAAQYLTGKRREWEEYRSQVSQWEVEKYLVTY